MGRYLLQITATGIVASMTSSQDRVVAPGAKLSANFIPLYLYCSGNSLIAEYITDVYTDHLQC